MASGGRSDQTPPPPPFSVFDLPPDFFDSCRILSDPGSIPATAASVPSASPRPSDGHGEGEGREKRESGTSTRWTCNTCMEEFASLAEQREHFKSDLHRLNVKLNVAGKRTIKEDEFEKAGDGSLFEDCDISSISGSEDEDENETKDLKPNKGLQVKEREVLKKKLHILLQSGDIISLWKCLLMKEHEELSQESISNFNVKGCSRSYARDDEVIIRLKYLIQEPRDKSHLRIVLLASGGHFAGCVFDGNHIIAHKTFHRYVVRAKAGKKQSTNDATGKAAKSAGSSLRRYNEAALKKEIQDLFVSWKSYFAASSCIFVHAPSKNYQYFFDGEDSILTRLKHAIRNVPLTVRRPTLKEAKRVFNHLTHVTYALNREVSITSDVPVSNSVGIKHESQQANKSASCKTDITDKKSTLELSDSDNHEVSRHETSEIVTYAVNDGTALHEAVKSGDVSRTLELLEQGYDPCAKNSRGQTPYTMAKDKEIRNTFRRFMALNLEKWDWRAANVPSPLTKEMEVSQAEKQAEKDAKKKAKAKELKKLRKAKEKAQAQAALSQGVSATTKVAEKTVSVGKYQLVPGRLILSKEEEKKRELDEMREKRAAAAERRLASLGSLPTNQTTQTNTPKLLSPQSASGNDIICSCCNSSLAGKVPFHRYQYKYCSTTCMHVHREMLEG